MKKIRTIISYAALSVIAMTLAVMAGCSADAADGGSPSGDNSQGGSMARFTIVGDYMYTVDNRTLKVVSLAIPGEPFAINKNGISVGFDIETLFSMGDKLFIGSRSAMYIYDISNPEDPYKLGEARHFTSCDPVVAHGNYAYVTLNSASGWWCGNNNRNVLQVYDITDIKNPKRIEKQTQNLVSPKGLAIDGDEGMLFVCDDGLVVAYKITEPASEEEEISLKRKYSTSGVEAVRGMNAYDCIALGDGTLIVTGDDGIYQLGYDDTKFTFISSIDLRKQ